jgi:hypothetical protein
MRTDKMMAMINSDSDSMAAFKRGRVYKAVAAFVILFGFGAIAVIAPPTDSEPMVSSTLATKAADPSESSRHDSYFGHGASIDGELTNGVDMHG